MSDIAKAMTGAALIGAMFAETERNIDAIPFVLAGDMDNQLERGFFMLIKGPNVKFESGQPEVVLKVAQLKSYLRSWIQALFKEVEHQENMARRAKLEQLRSELKMSSQPHELGTVAEIAAKYGISKSEVRRRKADGTLHELAQQAQA